MSTTSIVLHTTFFTTDIIDKGVYTGLEKTRQEVQIAVEVTILCIIMVLSLLGNILVCLVIYRSRRVQSTTNYFVVSLAFSDIMMSLLCVPPIANTILTNEWHFGSVLCRIIRFIQLLAPTSVIYVLVSICIDRFYSIIYPLSFKITRGTAKRMTICCWFLSVFCCSFALIFFDSSVLEDGTGREMCPTYVPNITWSGILYASLLVALTYLLPMFIIVTVYYKIFKYIWRVGVGKRRLQRTMNPVPRTKVKMVKMLIIVSGSTLVFSAPFYCVQIWYTVTSAVYVDPSLFIAIFCLLYLTTLSKPLIYISYNSNFRRGCKEVFCMSTLRCYRGSTYAITTASNLSKKNHIGIMPIDNTPRPLDSPSRTFNRSVLVEKTAWPMAATISSTYL